MKYYCVATKVSNELKVKKGIQLLFNRLFEEEDIYYKVIFPTKDYKAKKGKFYFDVSRALTPGYIFIKTDVDLNLYSRDLKTIKDCYGLVVSNKLVEKSQKSISYQLVRGDLEYAVWIFSNDGQIIPSKITLKVGTSVSVISGPLATFNGKIVKVDKRNNKVCIFSENSGILQKVWVPVEIVKDEDVDSNTKILKEFSKVY